MALRFRCPCGTKVKTHDEHEGRRARCPKCGVWLRVPKSSTYDTVAEVVPAKADLSKLDAVLDAKAGAAPAREAGAPPGSPPVTEGRPLKGRVLVADSNEEDRRTIIALLRVHRYAVVEAPDGAQALDLIRKERPDAVVLNVRLDGMSGFQVLQQVRNMANELNKEIWNTPALMTTERIQGRDKQYSMSLGVGGYFVKPVVAAQFVERLEKVVAKHQMR